MKIDAIYVSCYRHDVHLTRLCVASIRFWYPDYPIRLIKDERYGKFSTSEIERRWNASAFDLGGKRFGWGMAKLEVLFHKSKSRCLILDSDIVFAGRVLDELEAYDEDFVVNSESYGADKIESHIYSVEKLKQLDPGFGFPGFGFNTGQLVVTSGMLRREDFDPFVDWEASQVLRPDVFKLAEQGLLNYVVQRKANEGSLTLRRIPFMVWPGDAGITEEIQVEDFTGEGRHRKLIHWAGLRWGKTIEEMPRSDILSHFEKIYYGRVPLGGLVRRGRRARSSIRHAIVAPLKVVAKRVLSRPG